ncbi:unnamed protein product [Miscanthus lutarioriparius]|uniref:BTB domain-containing protein n=1 Tax=Miscanthus lutarioriparius TaxID=422564 RepID=A0A811Q3Z0_9POAL|nr:unnamed protein product [Miscanthus lutarioriparius]
MASVYRLPRNTICAPCHEGAKAIIGFLNKADEQQQEEGGHGSVLKSRVSMMKPDSATKGTKDAWEQLKEMRGREEEAHQRAAFLAQGLAMAWKEGVHTDIVVKPGAGPPIPAHKAILAARSEVFRHMLAADEAPQGPAGRRHLLPGADPRRARPLPRLPLHRATGGRTGGGGSSRSRRSGSARARSSWRPTSTMSRFWRARGAVGRAGGGGSNVGASQT